MQLTEFQYNDKTQNTRYFIDGKRVSKQRYQDINDRAYSMLYPKWIADSFLTVKTKTGYKHTHSVREVK